MKNAVFWNVKACSLVAVHWRFEERTASIFRVKEEAEQVTGKKQAAIRLMTLWTLKMEASLDRRWTPARLRGVTFQMIVL
jgi:hypothetical protein